MEGRRKLMEKDNGKWELEDAREMLKGEAQWMEGQKETIMNRGR